MATATITWFPIRIDIDRWYDPRRRCSGPQKTRGMDVDIVDVLGWIIFILREPAYALYTSVYRYYYYIYTYKSISVRLTSLKNH